VNLLNTLPARVRLHVPFRNTVRVPYVYVNGKNNVRVVRIETFARCLQLKAELLMQTSLKHAKIACIQKVSAVIQYIPGRPKTGPTGPLCFMVCIFRNSDQIGTKFGTNQSLFIVNILT